MIFPHGDNEIAIACGLNEKPLARFWMHSEVVMADGKKVSRATGNAVTLGDLIDQGFDGPAIRYWLLATHYRTVLKYSPGELQRAANCVKRLNEFVARLQRSGSGRTCEAFEQALYEARTEAQQAMDNGLNTAQALGKVFALLRLANRWLDDGQLDQQQVQEILDFMREIDRVLAVLDFEAGEPDEELQQLIDQRDQARQEGDFQRADDLRNQLLEMGMQVIDGPTGTRCRKL